jgi:hypothetical protein
MIDIVFKREKSEVTADLIELYFKDAYLTRADMWRLSSSLQGKCCFRTQRISYCDCVRATIFDIYRKGKKVKSAYIGADTRIIYRSESARMVYFLQISAEMWHFEESGQVIFHKMINSFLPEVFKRWHENKAHHVVTIILFTSVDVSNGSKQLGHGEVATETRDYFRVVVDQMHISKWSEIMAKLRHEFSTFDKDVLLQENGSIKGRILPAIKGNLLQAISIASSLVSSKFIDRDLRRTGLQTLIITPGAGIFDVDYNLLYQTSLKLLSIEIGIDLVCLSRAPLHVTPLFRYKNEQNEVKHCVPSWLDISFWSSTDRYTNQWIPRCKIYEIQMMGVMENEESSMSIDYLPDKLHSAEPLDEEMYKYDRELFSTPEFSSHIKKSLDDSAYKLLSKSDTQISTLPQKSARIETGNFEPISNARQSPRSISDGSAGNRSSLIGYSPYATIRKGTGILLLAPEVRKSNDVPSKLAKSSATTEVDLSQASIAASINARHVIEQDADNGKTDSEVSSLLSPMAKVIRKTLSFSRKASTSSLRTESISSSSELVSEETLKPDGFSNASRRLIEMFPGVEPKAPPSLDPRIKQKPSALSGSGTPGLAKPSLAVSISHPNFTSIRNTGVNVDINSSTDGILENLTFNPKNTDKNFQKASSKLYHQSSSPPSLESSSTSLRNMGTTRRLSESTTCFSTLKKKDHDFKSSRQTEERHSMWMTISNPSRCTNSNIANITNYGKWQYVYPKGVKRRTVKWRSLKSPASLPLITPVCPSANQYKDYTFKFYGVTLERETSEYDSVYKLLHEMVAVRLAMGFQIMSKDRVQHLEPPRSLLKIVEIIPVNPVGCRIYMSMGTVIHRLTCESEDKSNDITVHTHTNFELKFLTPKPNIAEVEDSRAKQSKVVTGLFVKTRYQKNYLPVNFDFFSNTVPMFNWNQVDQILTGYEDQVFNDPRMYRIRLVLVPVNVSGKSTSHDTSDKLTIEEYRLEGLKVLLTQLQRGIYDRSGKRETLRQAKKNIPQVEFYTGDFDSFLLRLKENLEIEGFRKDFLFIQPNERFDQQTMKLSQLAAEIQAPVTGIKLVDRTWHLRVHKRCFIGLEFVSWLLKNFKDIKKPNDAVIYGNLLMKQGLFHHVENRHTFLNGHYFYQLSPEYVIPFEAEKEKQPWFGQKRQQSGDNTSPPLTSNLEDNSSSSGTNGLGSAIISRTQSMSSIVNFKRIHQRKHSASNISTDSSKDSIPTSPKSTVYQDYTIAEQGAGSNASLVPPESETSTIRKKLPTIFLSSSMKYNVDLKKRSNRPENLTVHFDRVHNPENCYQLRFEWLNTTPKLVDEAIIALGKETEHYGLKLVQVPIQEISKLPDGNPFTSLYRTRLCLNPLEFVSSLGSPNVANITTPLSPISETPSSVVEEHPLYYHRYIVKSLGYVLDVDPISSRVSASLDVRYSWGKPYYENEQYVHKSGLSIVQIMADGEIVFMTNFLADSRMGSFSGTTTTVAPAAAIGKPVPATSMLLSQSSLMRGESTISLPSLISPAVLRKELRDLSRDADKLKALYLRAREAWITKGRSEVNENLALANGSNSRPNSTSSTPRLFSQG